MREITVIARSAGQWTRYRIVGTPTAAEWAKSVRPGHEPWCELTVYDGSEHVSSFGGEVWPPAWPELFTGEPPTIYSGANVRITDAGKSALAAAH